MCQVADESYYLLVEQTSIIDGLDGVRGLSRDIFVAPSKPIQNHERFSYFVLFLHVTILLRNDFFITFLIFYHHNVLTHIKSRTLKIFKAPVDVYEDYSNLRSAHGFLFISRSSSSFEVQNNLLPVSIIVLHSGIFN